MQSKADIAHSSTVTNEWPKLKSVIIFVFQGSGKKRVSEVPAATAAAVASGSTTPGRSTRSREPDVSIDLWKLGKSPPRF